MKTLIGVLTVVVATLSLSACFNDDDNNRGGGGGAGDQAIDGGSLLTQVLAQGENAEPVPVNNLTVSEGGEDAAATAALQN